MRVWAFPPSSGFVLDGRLIDHEKEEGDSLIHTPKNDDHAHDLGIPHFHASYGTLEYQLTPLRGRRGADGLVSQISDIQNRRSVPLRSRRIRL